MVTMLPGHGQARDCAVYVPFGAPQAAHPRAVASATAGRREGRPSGPRCVSRRRHADPPVARKAKHDFFHSRLGKWRCTEEFFSYKTAHTHTAMG
eukprot:scaffold16768_cov117-Isochrysis_galbana.AAC.6